MDTLFRKSDRLLANISTDIIREKMDEIHWNTQLVSIMGAKGVGKSTLIKQYLKQNYQIGDRRVLYCSADTIDFSMRTLVSLAEEFVVRGGELLVIDEIQPACSAIRLMSELPDVVIPGDSVIMIFDFDTDKNTNMATHYIRIFGNIKPSGVAEMLFDVNIVRGTLDLSDYEERWFNRGQPDEMENGRKVRVSSYYIIPANADNLLGL